MRPTEEFEGAATTCQVCLTAPVRKKAAPVTRTTTTSRAPAAAPAPAGPRQPLLGAVGSGDLEVRERRAKRKAYDALAESHPEEFALLLRDARAAEGLRPKASDAPPEHGAEVSAEVTAPSPAGVPASET